MVLYIYAYVVAIQWSERQKMGFSNILKFNASASEIV